MSDKYAVTGLQDVNTAAPGDSTLSLLAVTSTRARIYDLVFSQSGAPADVVCEWLVRRFDTSAGTSTAVVPAPTDPLAPACATICGEDHTAEPTEIAATELLDFDLNQRATFRWVAAPGGELVMPLVATEGIYMTQLGTYTAGTRCVAHFEE